MRKEPMDCVHRPETMKAIVQDRYGSPDVLELREMDKSVVGEGSVLEQAAAVPISGR
jgi:NADPH:quinone reductase-like Zn-dependent oxidoreductase